MIGALLGALRLGSGVAETHFEFLDPAPYSAFIEGSEIPLVLAAQVEGETVTMAEVFVDGEPAGTAIYCCPVCRCPPPINGSRIELRLPSLAGGSPWQGLTNISRGFHQITATATGSGGTVVSAAAIEVVVLAGDDLRLRVSTDADRQLLFVLPGGSLVFGGFDMWVSHDLKGWTRLGPFEPGAVAAFFRDQPDDADPRPRYYRALPATAEGPTSIMSVGIFVR